MLNFPLLRLSVVVLIVALIFGGHLVLLESVALTAVSTGHVIGYTFVFAVIVALVLAWPDTFGRSHHDEKSSPPIFVHMRGTYDNKQTSRVEDHGHDHVPARSRQTFGAAAGHRVARAVAMFGSVLTLLPSGHLVMARSATHA